MSKQVSNTTQQQTANQNYTGNQTSTQHNDYGWMEAPINAQTQGVIDAANATPGSDPGLHSRYARMEEDVRRQYADPLGAYTTPFVRQRAQLGQLMKVHADEDQAKREDYYNQQQQQFGRKLSAAQLTNPQLVNLGGSSSGTTSGTSNATGNSSSKSSTGQNAFGQILDAGLGALS